MLEVCFFNSCFVPSFDVILVSFSRPVCPQRIAISVCDWAPPPVSFQDPLRRLLCRLLRC